MSWALAVLRINDTPLLDALGAATKSKLGEARVGDGSARHLANTAWSFATLLFFHDPLLASLSSLAVRTSSELNWQGIANLSWAMAVLLWHDGTLVQALADAAVSLDQSKAKPQELSNTIWAFACFGDLDLPLMCAVTAASESKLPEFKPQDHANVAWALATLQEHHQPLMDAMAARSITMLQDIEKMLS